MLPNTAIFGLLAGASLAAATPLVQRGSDGKPCDAGYDPRVGPSNAKCSRQTYDITVTSENTVFENVNGNANMTYQTSLLSKFVAAMPAASNFTEQFEAANMKNVTGTYSISGTLCTPESGDPGNGYIQLLVHGIGFDASYWDFAATGEDYSYVSAASAAGHSTFRYDRLGTGLSEHPQSTYDVVQAATDIAILTEIVSMLKNGKIGGQKYSKVAGLGHSYGSVQLQSLTRNVPSALDTVVLTGFSANTSFVSIYLTSAAYETATIVAPSRFPESLANGYLITSTPYTNQLNFAFFPYYTNEAITLARATEQPVTQGVLFTFGSYPGMAPSFTGNVHVVTGDRDWIFCGLNCISGAPAGFPSIPAAVTQLYPAAASFSTYIPQNVGHGLNFHIQAPAIYQEILSYLGNVFYK